MTGIRIELSNILSCFAKDAFLLFCLSIAFGLGRRLIFFLLIARATSDQCNRNDGKQ